jgi:hypothetical protein
MTTSPAARVPLRIQLDDGPPTGPLDGAWWPQTRDLQTESADLLDHFPAASGRIQRLLFSRPDWDTPTDAVRPRSIQAARGRIKAGSFPRDDTHLMVLQLASGRRMRLLVVPSSTDSALAGRAMDQAADAQNSQGAAQLLGVEEHALSL